MSVWLTTYETKSNCFWKCGPQILDEESKRNTMSAGIPVQFNLGRIAKPLVWFIIINRNPVNNALYNVDFMVA